MTGIDPLRPPVPLMPPREPASATSRRLRPLGYLGTTVVWVLLAALAIGVSVVALPLAVSAALDGAPLAESPAFTGDESVVNSVVLAILIPPIFGVVIYLLSLATLGQVLLSATLLVRSLRPRYRDERLSFTLLSGGGEAIGPMGSGVTGVALSLLPVRLSRWTKIAMTIGFNGWIPTLNVLVIGVPLGFAYVAAIVALLWPAEGALAVVLWTVAAAALLLALVLVWRRRRRLAAVMPAALRGTVYELSWPATAVPVQAPRPERTKPRRNMWGV